MKRLTIIALLVVASVVALGQSKRTPRNDFTFFQVPVSSVAESNNLLDNLTAWWPHEETNGGNRFSLTNTHTLINFGSVLQEANHKEGSFSSGMMDNNWLTNYDADFRLTNNWSMSGWVLWSNAPGVNDTIVARWGPDTSWILTISTGSNTANLLAVDGSQIVSYAVNSTVLMTASNWYHYAFGIDNSVIWLQVNNETRKTNAYTTLFATSDPLSFGWNSIIAGGNDVGTFYDATGFWSRNLSTNDVRQLYNGGSGLFFSSFRGSTPAGGTLTNSLISFWRMDEAAAFGFSPGTRFDAFGGNDLTDLGVNVFQGTGILTNDALYDGGNKTLSHADDAALSATGVSITLQAWVKLGSTADNQMVAGKWGATTEYLIYVNGGRFNFYRGNASGGGNVSVAANNFGAISTGVWYHVVGVQDTANNLLLIYVNTVSDSTAYSDAGLDGTAAFTVGQFDGTGGPITADIDLVGFWKRALTSGDVGLLYNSGAARDPVTNP